MRTWLIGVVVVVGLVAGVLPPVFGFVAEDRFRAALNDAPDNPQFDVLVSDYQRGLFRSTALITVKLDDNFAASLDEMQQQLLDDYPDIDPAVLTQSDWFSRLRDGLVFAVDVLHGPVSLSDGLFVGLSRSTTLIDAREGELREFQDKAALPYLLRVRADMGLTGATSGVLDVPAFSYTVEDVALEFSGFDAVTRFQPSNQMVDYAGSVAAVDFTVAGAQFAMRDFTTAGDFEFVSDVFSPGAAEMLVKSVRVEIPNEVPVTATNLGVDALLSLDSAGEYAGIEVNYVLDEVQGIQGHTLSDARLNMSFRQLEFAALQRYLRVSQGLNPFDAAAAEQAAQDMADSFYALLLGSPTVAFEPLQFSFDGQPFTSRLKIDFDGRGVPAREQLMANMAADPSVLLNMLSGDARIEVAEPLARVMATEFARNQLAATVTPDMEVTKADIDAAAEQQSAVLLSSLISQGMFTVNDAALVAELKYAGGLLTINDLPIPLGAPQ